MCLDKTCNYKSDGAVFFIKAVGSESELVVYVDSETQYDNDYRAT